MDGEAILGNFRQGVVQAIEAGHRYEEVADLYGVSISW